MTGKCNAVCNPQGMTGDRHKFSVRVGESGAWLEVACPYALDDETRPCWPCTEDDDGNWTVRMPAPQSSCTYDEQVENVAFEDIVHGERVVLLGDVTVRWEDGQMYLTIEEQP